MAYLPNTFSTRGERYKKPKHHRVTQFIRSVISFFTPKYNSIGRDNIPKDPCVFVSNHARAMGPIVMCTRLNRNIRPWVHADVCFCDTFKSYAIADFWPNAKGVGKALAYIVANLLKWPAPYLFSGMQAIPVYRDQRAIITFKKSVQTLREGLDIVLFPEKDGEYSRFVNPIDNGFVDLGAMFNKQEGLQFVPTYICPELKTICFGVPVRYDTALTAGQNRDALGEEILLRIDALAKSLPQHNATTYRK